MRRILIAVGVGTGLSCLSIVLFNTWLRPLTMVILWPGVQLVNWLQPSCFGIPHANLKIGVANSLTSALVIWIALSVWRFCFRERQVPPS